MTDRWSNPSGGLGIERFRVWPAGTDSYSHSDLTQNWDTLDGIIGIPSSGDWPPTTGIDGGIYNEVLLLQDERTPIGTVVAWFRPNGATSIPTNWHACDGTTLTSSFHDFPGGGSVTLPDLRNRFILGADASDANGAAAANVGDATIDTSSGAPGPQASGGSNKIVQSISQMPSHTHTFAGNPLNSHVHTFTGNALGPMPPHSHYSVDYPDLPFTPHQHLVEFANDLQGGGGRKAVVDFGGASGATDIYLGIDFSTSSDSAGSPGTPTGTVSSVSAGTPTGTNASTGSGSPMDNRPHWYGLIYICKVLYSS